MTTENKPETSDSTVIFIGGKKTTISEVQKTYATLSFLSKPSAVRIVQQLLIAKEPMTREQIAKQSQLSVVYTIDILNNLVKYGYVVPFHIASRKLIFYALSEKGHNALSSIGEKST